MVNSSPRTDWKEGDTCQVVSRSQKQLMNRLYVREQEMLSKHKTLRLFVAEKKAGDVFKEAGVLPLGMNRSIPAG